MVIKDFLEKNGYVYYRENYSHLYRYKNQYTKTVQNDSVCERNKCLTIFINEYMFDYTNSFPTFEISIKAKKNELEWDLKCFSLNESEVKERLKEIESSLINLFNCI